MKLTAQDSSMLGRLASEEDDILGRAVEWCALSSGSRNLPGLEAQRAVLESVMAQLPGEVENLPLADSHEVAADGSLTLQGHPDALMLTVRPQAPVQVVEPAIELVDHRHPAHRHTLVAHPRLLP